MLTTRHACMLGLTSVGPTGKSCPDRSPSVYTFMLACRSPTAMFFLTAFTNEGAFTVQWEYQVGPSVGIEAGDHIWCSRYILEVNCPFPFLLFAVESDGKHEVMHSSSIMFLISATENN